MYIEKVIAGRAFVDGELKYREVGIADGRIVTVGQLVRVSSTPTCTSAIRA